MSAYYSLSLDTADRTPLRQLTLGGVKLASFVLKSVNFRGMTRILETARGAFGSAQPILVATLPSGGRFCFPAFDQSWRRFFFQNRPYEPDLAYLMSELGEMHFDFLDCGANYGYWTAWVAGLPGKERTIVTVEPSPLCADILERNCRENKRRINLVKSAISDGSIDTVTFMVSDNHVASHIAKSAEPNAGERPVSVPAVSIDALAERFGLGTDPVMVKLDVEGFEVAAMRGAERLASGPSLFVYEDHGADTASEATCYMLENGFDVYFLANDNRLIKVVSKDQVNALKVEAHEGYNLVATKSRIWNERLASRLRIEHFRDVA